MLSARGSNIGGGRDGSWAGGHGHSGFGQGSLAGGNNNLGGSVGPSNNGGG
jgi:hypothetical protein